MKTIKINSQRYQQPVVNQVIAQAPWLEVKQYELSNQFSEQMTQICNAYQESKGWILVVNPDNELVVQLANNSLVNVSKVLRVAANKSPIDLDKIKRTLLLGNCSVVVLCDSYFNELEMNALLACAEKGNTHCIVLNSKHNLH